LGGCISGLVGIGGGSVSNLILLGYGFTPGAVAVTSSASNIFTMSHVLSQFIILGAISIHDSLMIVGLAILGSIVGNVILNWIVEMFQKPSIMVWLLFGLQVFALLVLPSLGLMRVINQGRIFMFSSPC
jgi:uncharacterized membrane protein YfcA